MQIEISKESLLILLQLIPTAKATGKIMTHLSSIQSSLRKFIPLSDADLTSYTLPQIADKLMDSMTLIISGSELDALESFILAKFNEVLTFHEFAAIQSIIKSFNFTIPSEESNDNE